MCLYFFSFSVFISPAAENADCISKEEKCLVSHSSDYFTCMLLDRVSLGSRRNSVFEAGQIKCT